jgi:hypothetical protein
VATPNSNFDQIVTTTLHNYLSTDLADNIFGALVLTKWLMANGRKKPASGGDFLVEPLMYGKNTTVNSYDAYDPIDTAAQTGISAAQYNWKLLAGSVTYSRVEALKNNSKEKVIDLLEQKVTQLEESLRDEFNTEAFSDGTGNSGKDVTGLQAMVAATGTLGGINRSTYTFWRAQRQDTAEALNEPRMRTMFYDCSRNLTKPSIIITTQALFEKYISLVQPSLRLVNTKMADLGFQNVEYMGIPIVFDEACPSGWMLFLNDKYLRLRVHPDADFKVTEKKEPANQLVFTQQVYWLGNLTLNNARFQGALTAKTA